MATRSPRSPSPASTPLAELKQRFVSDGQPLPRALEAALRRDTRAGAQAIVRAVEARRAKNRAEGRRLHKMLNYERPLWDRGISHVAGVDEAGMSPLAGPVVAAAVVFEPGTKIVGVDDSKRLSPAERERLSVVIRRQALGYGVGRVQPEEIDRLNIYQAGLLAMRRAVEALPMQPGYLLVDARAVPGFGDAQLGIVKGDQKSLSIAAASILAKTSRDAEMVALDSRYPGYGFAVHKGYPVRAHVQALRQLGVSPVHRRTFAPVRAVLGA